MKEIFAAFSAEVFRPLVTLLMPGFWSLVPGLVSFFFKNQNAWLFVNCHKTASSLCFLATATAAGMILENLGGEIENRFFSLYPASAGDDWYGYLALALVPEPIAYSYIRNYVQRLKFEAGMCVACAPALVGSCCLPLSWLTKLTFLASLVGLAYYLFFQVHSSVRELINVRRQLLRSLYPNVARYPATFEQIRLRSLKAWRNWLAQG